MTPPTRPSPTSWRLAPWASRLLVALFVMAMAAPGVATLAGAGGDVQRDDSTEAPAPGLQGLAARFDGHFAFRARLVRLQAWLRYALAGVSPLPTVWQGREHWWFYADDGAVEETLNQSPLTAAELDEWCATLQHTADWLGAQGIAYVFAIAPGKQVVYPEFLPAGVFPRTGATRVDQVVEALRTRTSVPVLDLRDPLLAAKAGGAMVFHRTDTHWNDVGAAIAYRAILRALPPVPGLAPPAAADAFTLAPTPQPVGDLANMLGLDATIGETELRLVPRVARRARIVEPPTRERGFGVPRMVTVVDDPALPRAVFYRDSFGSALIPFLAEHFQRMVALWEYDVVPAAIREERPQVVIQEWVGRRLYTRLPFDAVAADAAAAADLTRSAAARR